MHVLVVLEAGMAAGSNLEVAKLAGKARGAVEKYLPGDILEPAALFLVGKDRHGFPGATSGMPCKHLVLLP
jgi:hypothetical protein